MGTRFGRYEIIKHLATGGMAELFLARARGLEGFERHVVIKRIRVDQEHDPRFVEMFLTEARLAATLHHHNIVQVHDIGQEGGRPYFVMEYIHGESLRELLAMTHRKRALVPLAHVITIATAIATALHHAHERVGSDGQPLRIVHRDVTPGNIVIGYDGNVKVVDFGIAKATAEKSKTAAGMLKGKAPYMSPEQCSGATIDRRSDIFALGILLYELATVKRLFKGLNEFHTMKAVVSEDFPRPSVHRKDLPPALEAIILRALARAPADRYQTASDLHAALEAFAETANLRTSTTALATYMVDTFGVRPEPWLVEVTRPPAQVDFDDSGQRAASTPAPDAEPTATGVAEPPSAPRPGAATTPLPARVPIAPVPIAPVPPHPAASAPMVTVPNRAPPTNRPIKRTITPVPRPASPTIAPAPIQIPAAASTPVSVPAASTPLPPAVPPIEPVDVAGAPTEPVAAGATAATAATATATAIDPDVALVVVADPAHLRVGDTTAIVKPLPSPLLTDQSRRKSPTGRARENVAPLDATRPEARMPASTALDLPAEAPHELVMTPRPLRRWPRFAAMGVVVVVGLALAIGLSGRDPVVERQSGAATGPATPATAPDEASIDTSEASIDMSAASTDTSAASTDTSAASTVEPATSTAEPATPIDEPATPLDASLASSVDLPVDPVDPVGPVDDPPTAGPTPGADASTTIAPTPAKPTTTTRPKPRPRPTKPRPTKVTPKWDPTSLFPKKK